MTDTENEGGGGQQLDAPNKQAVGLDPPWVEGTGGAAAAAGRRGRRPSTGRQSKQDEKADEKADKKADGEQ